MTLIDGPHHLHMTNVDEVTQRIEKFITERIETVRINSFIRSKLWIDFNENKKLCYRFVFYWECFVCDFFYSISDEKEND